MKINKNGIKKHKTKEHSNECPFAKKIIINTKFR